jgi:cell division protein FtsL
MSTTTVPVSPTPTPTPTPTPVAPATPLLDTRAKLEILAVVAFLAGGIVLAHTLRAEQQARVLAESQVKTEQGKIKTYDAKIAELVSSDKIRDTQTAAQIKTIQATAAAAKTPKQIVHYLQAQEQLAGAPAPITVETPEPTAADPTPAAVATIPAIDLPFLRDQVARCDANALLLTSRQLDLTSCQSQLKIAGEKLSAAERERDDWKTAAKSGTWAKRIKSGAAKVGIGIGIGVAIGYAAHK